jgi:Domain of unknown function (DUF2760)
MQPTSPSLLSRLTLALRSFFAILARPDFAARAAQLHTGQHDTAVAKPESAPVAAPVRAPVAPAVPVSSSVAALQLLGLLQREARFVDFMQEDIKAYGDAEIGAAVRVVHEGCRKVLREQFSMAPVRSEPEGSRLTLPAGFDAAAIRLTGNVVGQAPFNGTLSHRGWRVTETRLPHLDPAHDASIVAQAEVEL